MGLDDEEEEGYFDDEDDNQSYSFPPLLSEYEAADMSVQPGITIDKARTDLYIQFKKEFNAIRGMLDSIDAFKYVAQKGYQNILPSIIIAMQQASALR